MKHKDYNNVEDDMTTTFSADAGNYQVLIRDDNSGFRRQLVVEENRGGWWTEIELHECPMNRKKAANVLQYVNTVATPTYERMLRLATGNE